MTIFIFAKNLIEMKLLINLTFLLSSLFIYGQNHATDSISGGEYHIDSLPEVDEFIHSSIQENCSKKASTNNHVSTTQNTEIDICARTPKVLGYKIQILYTKDRRIAERSLSKLSRNYPDLLGEMQYSRPDYRVLVGDFFTKRSAAEDLSRLKKEYPGALLVQWRVFCKRAK